MNNIQGHNPQKFGHKLKWIIAVLALGYLIYALFVKHNAQQLFEYGRFVFITNPLPLILVVILIGINWLLEAIKWRYLMKGIEPISLKAAVKGVLMGVTISLFTPNGIGEFAGRMLVVSKRNRAGAAGSTIAGSMAQLAITITIGGAFLVYISKSWLSIIPEAVVNISAIVTALIGLVAYFKMPVIVRFVLGRFNWFQKHRQFIETFNGYSRKELIVSYLISFLRYAVFCTQMFVLIQSTVTFESAITALTLMPYIPVFFYLQTLVPTIALGEIGVRGALLEMILPTAESAVPILMCTTIIWLLNIVLPALIGLVFNLRIQPD
ncbi:MAG: flippase-like domain-containing protein [Flavobacteriales bacterium]|nr:flippase-like domain-containing protein [Bacteroidota bacterium]MCB9241337.1 flippase-like domain-containing protein [Flavobacteriales bacterium]